MERKQRDDYSKEEINRVYSRSNSNYDLLSTINYPMLKLSDLDINNEKQNKEYNNYTTLKLTTKGDIPGVIEYSINTNLLFKQLDSYNYYKIVNNKYELINDKVVSIDNYISLNISDNNVYVLSDKIIKNNINIIIIIIISIVFIAILGFIIYYFIKKNTKSGIKFYKFKRINIS